MNTHTNNINKTAVYSVVFAHENDVCDSPAAQPPRKRQRLMIESVTESPLQKHLEMPEEYVLLLEKCQGIHWHQHIKIIQKLRSLRKPNFLKDRHILVEWMCEVVHEFRFKTTVLFSTMMLMDRFMATVQQRVKKDAYQGLVCACFSIACM